MHINNIKPCLNKETLVVTSQTSGSVSPPACNHSPVNHPLHDLKQNHTIELRNYTTRFSAVYPLFGNI